MIHTVQQVQKLFTFASNEDISYHLNDCGQCNVMTSGWSQVPGLTDIDGTGHGGHYAMTT